MNYITLDKLKEVTMNLDNAQDKFILFSIYNGIAGGRDMEELLNLKVSDIDLENNVIHLKDRDVEFDEHFKKIIEDTINQKIYFVENKHGNRVTMEEYTLNSESLYVIKTRPNARNLNGLEKMKYAGFRTRYYAIQGKCGIDITPSELETAGVINNYFLNEDEYTVLDIEYILRANGIKANSYNMYKKIKEVKKGVK